MKRRRTAAAWLHVASSAVRAVRYHNERGELDVRFEDGKEYRYAGVPRSKFRHLLKSDSIGQFVNWEIKPRYSVSEISRSSEGDCRN
jgi:hypothetical protein